MAMLRPTFPRLNQADVLKRLGFVASVLLVLMGMAHGDVWAQAAATNVAATQLPSGGQVSAGQAILSQSGNTLNINQSSQRAVVDWNTFNVGKDATVNFQQPNAQSSKIGRAHV